MKFTACYTKLENGYMGQLLEWPQVITEGETLAECRELLSDAASEMAVVYREDKIDIPHKSVIVEALSIPLEEALVVNVS